MNPSSDEATELLELRIENISADAGHASLEQTFEFPTSVSIQEIKQTLHRLNPGEFPPPSCATMMMGELVLEVPGAVSWGTSRTADDNSFTGAGRNDT